MPSTFRLLARAMVAVAVVWAALWALATLVDPVPRNIVVSVQVDPPAPPPQTAKTTP